MGGLGGADIGFAPGHQVIQQAHRAGAGQALFHGGFAHVGIHQQGARTGQGIGAGQRDGGGRLALGLQGRADQNDPGAVALPGGPFNPQIDRGAQFAKGFGIGRHRRCNHHIGGAAGFGLINLRHGDGDAHLQDILQLAGRGDAADVIFLEKGQRHANGRAADQGDGQDQAFVGRLRCGGGQGLGHDAGVGDLQIGQRAHILFAGQQGLILAARDGGRLLQIIKLGQHFRRQAGLQQSRAQLIARRHFAGAEVGNILAHGIEGGLRFAGKVLVQRIQLCGQVQRGGGARGGVAQLFLQIGALLGKVGKGGIAQGLGNGSPVAGPDGTLCGGGAAAHGALIGLGRLELGAQVGDGGIAAFFLQPRQVGFDKPVDRRFRRGEFLLRRGDLAAQHIARAEQGGGFGGDLRVDIGFGIKIGQFGGAVGLR